MTNLNNTFSMNHISLYRLLSVPSILTLIFFASCSSDDENNNILEQDKTVWVDNDIAKNNQRVHIKNEPIHLGDGTSTGKRAGKNSVSGNGSITTTSATDCNSGCTDVIDFPQTGHLNINSNQHVCITSSGSFTGNINMNGGTLSICGGVQLNNLNINNGGEVIVNTGATFALSSPLNVNNNAKFVNYSKAGVFVSGGVNNSSIFENYGIIDVSGSFNNNSNSELSIGCRINVAGNFHQNGDFDLNGYLNVNGTVYFNNPTGSNDFFEGSLISCNNIFINTTLNGLGNNYSKIDIASSTTINGNGNVQGLMDICDADGINTNNGTLAPTVTLCEAFVPGDGDCQPESGTPAQTEFVLVADVDAPVVPGINAKLSATSIQIIGNYGYVSWHLNEGPQDYAGLIEVYNISNPTNPQIVSAIWSTDIDFNHVYVDPNGSAANRKFWVVGSRDVNSGNLNSPGMLAQFDLTNEIFTNESFVQTDLPSFSGNCVVEKNNDLLMVSGNTGGALTRLNRTTEILDTELNQDGLKYLDFDNNKLILLKQGNPSSELAVFNLPVTDFNSPVHSIQVGSITPEDGKNVAHLKDDYAYVATGTEGLKIFDVNTGSSTPVHNYDSSLPGLVNGVSTDNEYIYIANGESGLHILNKSDFSFVGNYSYTGSANFTAADNDFIFVANGIGGIKIIRKD